MDIVKKKQTISFGLYRLLYRIAKDRINTTASPQDVENMTDPVKLDNVINSEKKLKEKLRKL